MQANIDTVGTTSYNRARKVGSIMATNCTLQVRVDREDKDEASHILEGLGTNLSAAVNMLLKQIIITKSIPFEVSQNTIDERISYVKSTMALEGLDLTKDEIHLLKDILNGKRNAEEERKRILAEMSE